MFIVDSIVFKPKEHINKEIEKFLFELFTEIHKFDRFQQHQVLQTTFVLSKNNGWLILQ